MSGRLEEAEDLLRVLLAIYRVLDRVGDSRAHSVLSRAHDELIALAESLDADSRQTYLQNVSWNREILSLWEEHAGR